MKKIFTLLLLAPVSLFAQKFQVSILGGVSHIAVKTDDFDKKTSFSSFGSLQGSYQLSSFSIGVKADFYKIKVSNAFHTFNMLNNDEYDIYIASNFYNPALNISLFSNYNLPIGESDIYFGVNIGYLTSLSNSLSFEKYPKGTYVFPLDDNGMDGSSNGLTFGIQLGYDYNISQRFKIKAELSPRYIYSMNVLGEKDNNHDFNTIAIPFSVGVGVSF